jgi:5-methylcytosine-specific restriction enzyme subunit McrC
METDISIRDKNRTIIIDTKYYTKTLQNYYDKESIHSANLYQLFAYLKNLEVKGGQDAQAEGMLLYPTVKQDLDLTYDMQGHKMHINTVDLSQEWTEIRDKLLSIIEVDPIVKTKIR